MEPPVSDVVAAPVRPAAAAKPITAGATLVRGMFAGLGAGILSGLFQLGTGEKAIDEAIRLEHLAAAAAGEHGAEMFSRSEQRIGMMLATALFGIALGGVLAIVFHTMSRRMTGTAWERALKVALGGFAAFFLVPFLKYPANPPGVGDPDTIGLRTATYLFMALASVSAFLAAVAMARGLRAKGMDAHRRHLTVGLCYLLVVGVAFLAMPAAGAPGSTPAQLLWDFRLASLGGQLILWAATGAGLGLLMMRVEGKAAAESKAKS